MIKGLVQKFLKYIVWGISVGASIFIEGTSNWITSNLNKVGLDSIVSQDGIKVFIFICLLIILVFADNFSNETSKLSKLTEKLSKSSEKIAQNNDNERHFKKIEKLEHKFYISTIETIKDTVSNLQEDTAKILSLFTKNCTRKELIRQKKIGEFNTEIEALNNIVIQLTRLDSLVEKRLNDIKLVHDNENVI